MILQPFFFLFFFFSARRRKSLRPDSKSIEFIHGRLPKARQTRRVPAEIELKSNGPTNEWVNKSTRMRNAITVYKTSECFSRAHKFRSSPGIFVRSASGRKKEKGKEKKRERKKDVWKKGTGTKVKNLNEQSRRRRAKWKGGRIRREWETVAGALAP